VFSAAGVGAPHLRRRLFILAHSQSKRRQGWSDRSEGQSAETCGLLPAGSGECANVAYPTGQQPRQPHREQGWQGIGAGSETVADAEAVGRLRGGEIRRGRRGLEDGSAVPNAYFADQELARSGPEPVEGAGWWKTEPDVGRVVDGLAFRVDRLRAIGEGVVPQVAARAWTVLSGRLARERAQGRLEMEVAP
jgi:DNA (cytosine-5)-methyltransferase 1